MKHVYCTNCVYFKVKEIDKYDFIPTCKHEFECCLEDCEDSKDIKERHFYKEKDEE